LKENQPPTVLILASGRGERFLASGGTTHKLDALLPARDGQPAKTVLQTTLDAVVATGLPYHVERQAHAGMGDAIAAAVAKTADANGWLMLPADMPLIDPHAILALAQALQEDADASIIVPITGGQRGHPVGFPKACRADLLALAGDAGAKSLFQKYKTKKIHVDEIPSVTFPEGCLIDMDTVQDLEKINKLISSRQR
jgi:molybdenum cofactor cytidylyltransferase